MKRWLGLVAAPVVLVLVVTLAVHLALMSCGAHGSESRHDPGVQEHVQVAAPGHAGVHGGHRMADGCVVSSLLRAPTMVPVVVTLIVAVTLLLAVRFAPGPVLLRTPISERVVLLT